MVPFIYKLSVVNDVTTAGYVNADSLCSAMSRHHSQVFEGTDKNIVRRGDWSIVGIKQTGFTVECMPSGEANEGKVVIARL